MTASSHFLDGRVTLHPGDCLEVLRRLPSASIDSCVTDPPYALVSIGKRFGKDGAAACRVPEGRSGAYARASAGFMGKSWDTGERAFAVEFWAEVWRVLKPGGHVLAFGGTRSYHRLACAIEDAGFEKRDAIADLFDVSPEVRRFVESLAPAQLDAFLRLADILGFEGLLAWAYGTGFPKSHDVSKAIDAKLGGVRDFEPVGAAVKRMIPGSDQHKAGWEKTDGRAYQPGVSRPAPEAAALWEGWGTALKPAWEPIVVARKPLIGTVAVNVMAHGTGALNIDGCRVEGVKDTPASPRRAEQGSAYGDLSKDPGTGSGWDKNVGRWPANVVHDGSDEVLAAFAEYGDKGGGFGKRGAGGQNGIYSAIGGTMQTVGFGDTGSAARFFYSAKADAEDRLGSKHPTVKRVDLMQWLVRLVTPPGGLVLDPFAGTGTTGEAAWREGMRAVLIERETEYQADISRRMGLALSGRASRRAVIAKVRGRGDAGPLFTDVA